MANIEQLSILVGTSEAEDYRDSYVYTDACKIEDWNVWRARNPSVSPDLSGVNFNATDFLVPRIMDLGIGAAVLENLPNVYAAGIDFSRTDLSNSTFYECRLHCADLREANLTGSHIQDSELVACELSGANFEGATFLSVRLSDLDLAGVRNLPTVEHRFPSSLALDTLIKSHGDIPENFLRGCGVPASFIEYQRSLLANPIEFYSCFISYSHTDKDFARRLHDRLEGRGIRCWLDEKRIKIGDEILPGVLDAIRVHDRVLLCCSEGSLTSNWVHAELEETFEKEEKDARPILFPLNLDGYLFDGWKGPLAVEVRKRLAADFTGWEQDHAKFEEQFERVVEALKEPACPD